MKQPLKLLLVEDSEDDAFLLLRELRSVGEVDCKRVDTADQLRQALPEQEWDLVISDYALPGFNGLAALEIVKRHNADLPFIIVSGTIGETIAVEAMRAGAHDYIMKNNLARLMPAVERELREASVRRERSSAEEAYRRSESRFRQLAENIDEVFWMTDANRERFLYVSPAFEKIWGHACEDLYARASLFWDGIHEEDRAGLNEALSRNLPGETYDKEYRIVRPDGEIRWIRDRAFPVRGKQNELVGIAGVAEDITEKKSNEETKGSLEAQLRQAQKMEAIGTLAGGIAHDFNNILGAVMGYVELAMDSLEHNHPAAEDLAQVALAIERAKNLVAQILTFSRKQEQEFQPSQLSHVVKEAMHLLRATLPSSIEINQHIEPSLPLVMADSTQIHQIIMNLATNAAHAMDGIDGVLDAKLTRADVDVAMAEQYPDLNPGAHLQLEISDNGAGMPPDVLNRIFDPFFSTKQPGEGTGMGLSVVHGIVKQHHGCITVRSQLGKGTTFAIYLPTVEAADEVESSGDHSVEKGQGQHILFVDDETQLVRLGTRIFEKLGYQVTPHGNSLEALSDFRSRPEQFDILVSDLTMPKLSGIELAGRIWEMRPDLPVIIVTGFTDSIHQDTAEELGISQVIMKPYSSKILGESIHRVLRDRELRGFRPQQPRRSTGMKILVLDDEKAFGDMLVNLLKKCGYDGQAFCSSSEALASFRKTPADLIILDIIMPDKEGLECIAEFRAIRDDVKIIAISGGGMNNPSEYLSLARKMGADDAFPKPLPTKKLMQSIADHLATGRV